jgi:hypothetical protein
MIDAAELARLRVKAEAGLLGPTTLALIDELEKARGNLALAKQVSHANSISSDRVRAERDAAYALLLDLSGKANLNPSDYARISALIGDAKPTS